MPNTKWKWWKGNIFNKQHLRQFNFALIYIFVAQFAVIRIRENSNKKFVGAEGKISIHNPHVDGRQYSAARVSVRNGPHTIAAGWRVRPSSNPSQYWIPQIHGPFSFLNIVVNSFFYVFYSWKIVVLVKFSFVSGWSNCIWWRAHSIIHTSDVSFFLWVHFA